MFYMKIQPIREDIADIVEGMVRFVLEDTKEIEFIKILLSLIRQISTSYNTLILLYQSIIYIVITLC